MLDLKRVNFTITANSSIHYQDFNYGFPDGQSGSTNFYINNDETTISANTYFNSINYNIHKLMYIYYKPIIVNNLNNSIILNGKTYLLDVENYKTYTYDISKLNVTTELLILINNIISSDNYTLIIENERYKLSHTTDNFIITETNLSKLLGLILLFHKIYIMVLFLI